MISIDDEGRKHYRRAHRSVGMLPEHAIAMAAEEPAAAWSQA